jgi:hypothetical protein
MDTKEKNNWARHYDGLLWTSAAIMSTAIGGLLLYLASAPQFDLILALFVINITILTVYFSTSFRELRFIFQDNEKNDIEELIENREFIQWWPYVIIFLLLCLVWIKLLLDKLPGGSIYWVIIGILNLIFIIALGIRAEGNNLGKRKENIQNGRVNMLRSRFWLFIIIIIIIMEAFLVVSFLNKWNILVTSFVPAVIIFGSLVVLIDKIEHRVIDNRYSYYTRVIFSSVYLITSFAILAFFKDRMFYAEQITGFADIFRFIWCINSSLFGFALIASQDRFNTRLPYGPYLFYYPPILLAISALIYSLLSVSRLTNNYIFYFFSFSLCFILAFLVDNFWSIILKFLEKARIMINKLNS